MKKDRADKMLVEMGLAETRSKAAQLIERGEVLYEGQPIRKPSQKVGTENLEVIAEQVYVGRGAFKLLEAIKEFNLNLEGKVVADVGASTGGFTEVSLNHGAKKVFAIDVGHDQLDSKLKTDERVIDMEGTNIRDIESLPDEIDIVVCDLSFISLETVYEPIFNLLKDNGEAVLLIKPQFELDKKSLGKKGIVKDPDKQFEALQKVSEFLFPQKACVSPIKGKEGNIEFLFYCIKGKSSSNLSPEELKSLVGEAHE